MKPLSPRVKGLLWLLVLVAVVFGGVKAMRWSVTRVSWERERSWAKQLEPYIGESACESSWLMRQVIAPIYPESSVERSRPIRVRVIDEGVINAFASLGGEIFVYRGLIRKAARPEALAGVLAHEIEHSVRRHVLSALSEQGVSLGILALFGDLRGSFGIEVFRRLTDLSYGRVREREADEGALIRLKKAGLNAEPWAEFFETLLKEQGDLPEWLSDHPSLKARIQRLREFSQEEQNRGVKLGNLGVSTREWERFREHPCR